MAKPNSSGSSPRTTGKKSGSSTRQSAAQMNQALSAALKRLGDPVVEYRKRRDQLVKRKRP